MRFVAETAKLLGVDLHGLLIEDERLVSAAKLPFTRVFQPLRGEWQPLSAEELERSLENRMAASRREFAATAEAAGIAMRCNIARMASMEGVLAEARASDVLVIAEPETPADCAFQPIEKLAGLALSGPAAVMLVPAPIARRRGSILAVVRAPDDPAVAQAATIAAAAHEPVEIVTLGEGGEQPSLPGFGRPWGRMNERLIVMNRSSAGTVLPLTIALRRRVPVLALGVRAASALVRPR